MKMTMDEVLAYQNILWAMMWLDIMNRKDQAVVTNAILETKWRHDDNV